MSRRVDSQCDCVSAGSDWLLPDMSVSDVLQTGTDWPNRSCACAGGAILDCRGDDSYVILMPLQRNYIKIIRWVQTFE